MSRAKEENVVSFRHEKKIICSKTEAKQSWTTLRMNRPLLVGSYLQATGYAFVQ